jgi:hypothetical protein
MYQLVVAAKDQRAKIRPLRLDQQTASSGSASGRIWRASARQAGCEWRNGMTQVDV